MGSVSDLIFTDFFQPKIRSRLGDFEISTGVSMPKAAVHKHHCVVFW